MEFIHNQNRDISGTSLLGYVQLAPAKLIEVFGNTGIVPSPYKVTLEYVFDAIAKPDVFFTIYDYKQTTAYWSDAFFTPEEFRASIVPCEFHVGSFPHNSVYINSFIDWLQSTTNSMKKTKTDIYKDFVIAMQK